MDLSEYEYYLQYIRKTALSIILFSNQIALFI